MNDNISFEEALNELEKIVNELEKGNAPLDASLDYFEKGVHLVNLCNTKLDEAEQRIKIVNTVEGVYEEKDFNIKNV